MDQCGPGGPRERQLPLVDQERSGPPWTTIRHCPDGCVSLQDGLPSMYTRRLNSDRSKSALHSSGTFIVRINYEVELVGFLKDMCTTG